ncbi:hypothetical protein BLNAU_18967 [Blattamonas nauphoetae]|uniref:Uncharacterized protein n=1 Tax=Blattamonas nauphoetae TaxID=2049346 RepID=A0ABQ9X335_9EUKA|nr:hypothetical protein BLNAU_18967 [Blattamonas nauphoetae]
MKWSPDLKYETEYEVSSVVSLDGKQTVSTSSLTFRTPTEPARIEKCLKAELDKDRTKVRLFFEGQALDSEMGLIWLKDGSTFWSSVSSLTAADSTHCFADFAVSSSESAERVEFGKEYAVSIKEGETTTFTMSDGIKASIPFPPRLLSASFAFTNTLLTSCSVSFVGADLPVDKDFAVTLSPTLSFVIRVVDAERAESSQLRIGWLDTLQFSTNYTIVSIVPVDEDEGEILFDPSLSFETEAEPARIIRCVSSVLSVDGKILIVQLEGRALEGNIGRVCLTRNGKVWESIEAMTVSSTTLSIAEFKVGEEENEEGVGIGKEYTLIGMSDGSSGCVVEEGIRIVVSRQTVMCRKGGSGEAEKCGQPSNPCSSLLVGWMAGQREEGSSNERVELEVDAEVEIGGVLFVGEKKVRVWGGSKRRGRMVGKWGESWDSMNAIEIDGGQVSIVEVTILLGSGREEGMEKRKSFLICGGGEVCVERVVVESVGEGRVVMGLVGLWWGSADLVSIEMEGIEFGDGVGFVEVGKETKIVGLSLCSLKARRVRTLNAPLISFLGLKEESEVKTEKVILLETTREESGDRFKVEEGGVMSVKTKQHETSFVGCVFEGSKTRRVGDGDEVGGVLFVGVGRMGGGDVRFEDCLMIDSVPLGNEGGGVVVVASSGVFRVWFERCWMEETRVSGIPFEHLNGVPFVNEKRRVVSGVGVVGALIIGEKSLPIVGRSSSRFSGCSLKVVVGREATMARQMNEGKKLDLDASHCSPTAMHPTAHPQRCIPLLTHSDAFHCSPTAMHPTAHPQRCVPLLTHSDASHCSPTAMHPTAHPQRCIPLLTHSDASHCSPTAMRSTAHPQRCIPLLTHSDAFHCSPTAMHPTAHPQRCVPLLTHSDASHCSPTAMHPTAHPQRCVPLLTHSDASHCSPTAMRSTAHPQRCIPLLTHSDASHCSPTAMHPTAHPQRCIPLLTHSDAFHCSPILFESPPLSKEHPVL